MKSVNNRATYIHRLLCIRVARGRHENRGGVKCLKHYGHGRELVKVKRREGATRDDIGPRRGEAAEARPSSRGIGVAALVGPACACHFSARAPIANRWRRLSSRCSARRLRASIIAAASTLLPEIIEEACHIGAGLIKQRQAQARQMPSAVAARKAQRYTIYENGHRPALLRIKADFFMLYVKRNEKYRRRAGINWPA